MASRSPATTEPRSATPPAATLRAWRRAAGIAVILAVHLLLHGLWRLAGRRSPWPRSFLGAMAWAGGIDVAIEGAPLGQDALFVANHLTWFDIPVLAGATGARFVSKAEVADWPLIGFLAGLNRTVYVARADRGRVAEQADRLRAALAERVPVAMFPEGGTGDGIALRPFRASLLAALLPPLPGIRLQPIAVDYGLDRAAMAWTSGLGFGGEMMRLLGLPGRRHVVLRFLPPLDPTLMPDRKRLCAAAQDAITAALGEEPRGTL